MLWRTQTKPWIMRARNARTASGGAGGKPAYAERGARFASRRGKPRPKKTTKRGKIDDASLKNREPDRDRQDVGADFARNFLAFGRKKVGSCRL